MESSWTYVINWFDSFYALHGEKKSPIEGVFFWTFEKKKKFEKFVSNLLKIFLMRFWRQKKKFEGLHPFDTGVAKVIS